VSLFWRSRSSRCVTSSARQLGLRRFHLTVGSTTLREICLLWKFVRSEPRSVLNLTSKLSFFCVLSCPNGCHTLAVLAMFGLVR